MRFYCLAEPFPIANFDFQLLTLFRELMGNGLLQLARLFGGPAS